MFENETALRAKVEQVVGAADGTVFFMHQELVQEDIGGTGASLVRQWLVEMNGHVAVRKRYTFFRTLGGQCWFNRRMYSPSRNLLSHDYEVVSKVPTLEDVGGYE